MDSLTTTFIDWRGSCCNAIFYTPCKFGKGIGYIFLLFFTLYFALSSLLTKDSPNETYEEIKKLSFVDVDDLILLKSACVEFISWW